MFPTLSTGATAKYTVPVPVVGIMTSAVITSTLFVETQLLVGISTAVNELRL